MRGNGELITILFDQKTEGSLDAVLNETTFTNVSVEGSIPVSFGLAQNFSNPFNPVTSISFNLPEAVHVKLTIFNILSQQVRPLVNDVQAASAYTLVWDGKDTFGRGVASGIYYCRMETQAFTTTRKMMFIK